ncbi:MAG: zinc ribbon domain-containing protein, partial [Candidatus Hodarchaeota archaeon]
FCREGTDYGIDKIKNAGSFLLPATLSPITAIILSLLFSFGGYSYSYGPSYSYETTSNVLRIITIGCSFLKIPAWVSMARYFSEQEGSTAQEKGKGGCVVLSIGVIASIGGVVVSLALSPWRSIMGPSIVEAIIGAVSSCLIAVGYIVVAKSLQEVETAPLTPAYVGGYRTMGAPGYQPSYQPGYQPRVGPSPVATRVPIVGPQPSGYPQAGGYPQPVATPPPAAGRQGDLHFCRHCGQTLPEGTEIVFCPNCGGKVTMG